MNKEAKNFVRAKKTAQSIDSQIRSEIRSLFGTSGLRAWVSNEDPSFSEDLIDLVRRAIREAYHEGFIDGSKGGEAAFGSLVGAIAEGKLGGAK
jgi:hypothetical protein